MALFTRYSLTIGVMVFGLAAQLAMAAPGNSAPAETMTADPALESRLAVLTEYKVRQGDTLRKIANALYGHSTWWPKLIQWNPALKSLGPDSPLVNDQRIRYRAPQIGSEYVVQKNDCLVRIAEWKYGSRAYWEYLYRQNSAHIQSPNLIHPGDRLKLSEHGLVQNEKSGEILMHSVASSEPQRSVASEYDLTAPTHTTLYYGYYGFAFGLLLLLLTPAVWAFNAASARRKSFQHREPIFREEYEQPVEQAASHFKKAPIEEPRIDRSMVPHLAIDLERIPNYFSLLKKPLWKYMQLLRKK